MAYPSLFDQSKLGNVYMCSNQAVVTLSALSTTMTGLGLMNPVGSGVNLHLLNVTWAISAQVVTASEVGLASAGKSTSAQPTTNAVSIYAANLGAGGGLGLGAGNSRAAATSGATMVGSTPVLLRMLTGINASTATTTGIASQVSVDLDGSVIVAPGCSIQLAYVTTAQTGLGSFVWMELPI